MKRVLSLAIILISIFIFCLSSCKKDKGPCWECSFFGTINGVDQSTRPHETFCGPESEIPEYEDEFGNNLNSQCVLKP